MRTMHILEQMDENKKFISVNIENLKSDQLEKLFDFLEKNGYEMMKSTDEVADMIWFEKIE